MKNKKIIIGLAAVVIVVLSGIVLNTWKSVEDSQDAFQLSDQTAYSPEAEGKMLKLLEPEKLRINKVELKVADSECYAPLYAYRTTDIESIKGPVSVYSTNIQDNSLEQFLKMPNADHASVVMNLICNNASFSVSKTLGEIRPIHSFERSALLTGDFAQDFCGSQSAVGIFSDGENTIGIEFEIQPNFPGFNCDPVFSETVPDDGFSKVCKESKECTINYFNNTEHAETLKSKMTDLVKALKFGKEE